MYEWLLNYLYLLLYIFPLLIFSYDSRTQTERSHRIIPPAISQPSNRPSQTRSNFSWFLGHITPYVGPANVGPTSGTQHWTIYVGPTSGNHRATHRTHQHASHKWASLWPRGSHKWGPSNPYMRDPPFLYEKIQTLLDGI